MVILVASCDTLAFMPSLPPIVSVVLSFVLVASSALPCPCGPHSAEDEEVPSCCAGMAIDDGGKPTDSASSRSDELPHDAADCAHCQPDETTLIIAGADVAPSAMHVLRMTGFVDVTAIYHVAVATHVDEPRGPPERPPLAAAPALSNRDLLTLIDVLRC